MFILGQIKTVKKGRPATYSFSGITAKQATKSDHKGKKKHAFVKGQQGNQGKQYARNNYNTSRNTKFQNHGNSKRPHHKNKNSLNNTKQTGRKEKNR